MRIILFVAVSAIAAVTCGSEHLTFPSFAQKLRAPRVEQTPTGVRMVRDGKLLWNFEIDAPEGRPFFHPLALPSGKTLTDCRPKDHVWHLGYWFSWKYVNGVNYWEPADAKMKGVEPAGRTRVVGRKIDVEGEACTVTLKLAYGPRESGTTDLEESRVVEIAPPDARGGYSITTRHAFKALRDCVLDRTPPWGATASGRWGGGYAGPTLRLDPQMAARLAVFGESGGRSSAAVTGAEEKSVDFRDPETGEGVRLVQMKAPSSARFYLWPDRRMINMSPCYGEPIRLGAGEALELEYRLDVLATK